VQQDREDHRLCSYCG
jgi:hypothetical protein